MNPYLIVGLMVAWIASLVGVGDWQYAAGEKAERLTWQSAESVKLQKALADVSRLRRQSEADAETINAISAKYQETLKNEKAIDDRTSAAIRTGTIKLRQPAPTHNPANGITAPSPGAGGRDGGETRELSVETSGFLYGLAAEADEVALQLKACQSLVIADRVEHPEEPTE